MLSLDFVCQHPDLVQDALRKRHDTRNIDDILRLAEQRRGLITRNDGLYAALKKLKEAIRTTSVHKRTALNEHVNATTKEIQQLEIQLTDTDTRLQLQLLSLPNLPHASVVESDGTTEGEELRVWGQPLSFYFEPLPHWELGARLGIIDSESAVKIAGSRFVTLKNAGARLERALIAFMLDIHTREHGYTEILPPTLVKRSVMIGAGQLPKFEGQVYVCPEDDLYLNPTAEVPLLGMHSDSVFAQDELPLRYAAWTTAFRREAGSASRHTRGLLRLHQFNKVELFQYTLPQNSYTAFDQIVQHAEKILQYLELCYRVIILNAANLPFAAAKAIDIEVWMPGMGEYVEVSSVSNCEAFQAQRANIKYKPEGSAHSAYVHTLNGSGLAIGRTMAALLETYQQADGSIVVPKVLVYFTLYRELKMLRLLLISACTAGAA
jgi:seryl-tRNA synthetase